MPDDKKIYGHGVPRHKIETPRTQGVHDLWYQGLKEKGVDPDSMRHDAEMSHQSLHEKRYRNFLVKHGAFEAKGGHDGRVVLHFFHVNRDPEAFDLILKRHFSNRAHPPEITYEPDVFVGQVPRGNKTKGVGSHSVLWREHLSHGMLGWINQKVRALDELMSKREV